MGPKEFWWGQLVNDSQLSSQSELNISIIVWVITINMTNWLLKILI